MSAGRLHPDDLAALTEAVAVRVVELLREDERPKRPERLLSATEAAERLGVDRDYIYRHADALGARRLGDGPKGRLRFPAEAVEAWIARLGGKGSQAPSSAPDAAPRRASRQRAARPSATEVELLPIRRPTGGAS